MTNTALSRKQKHRKKRSLKSNVIIFLLFIVSLLFFVSSLFLTQKKREMVIPPTNTSLTEKTQTQTPVHPSQKPREKRFSTISKENRAPRIPVLLYHDIQNIAVSSSPTVVTKQNFEEQLSFLKNNGYTTITLDEFIAAYTGNLDIPKKSVLITFDNGYISLKQLVNPFLIKNNLNAVAFVVGQHTDNHQQYLSVKDIYDIQVDRNFDIESKSFNLFNADTQQSSVDTTLSPDFINDNKKMEDLIGHKVNAFSYPLAKLDANSIKNIESANIQFGFGITSGKADWIELNSTKTSPYGDVQNPLALPRIPITNNTSIQQFEKFVTDELL